MAINLSKALVRGALWSIVMRWSIRFIGLLSTLVIARLLTPADYGLIAMATLVSGLIETFLDADATTALLRSSNTDPDFIDSAWTLRVLQSAVVAAAVAIAAPFAALYFEEPRLASVLWASCIVTIGSGLGSVGPVLARRDLDFFLEVKLGLFTRVVAFVATIGLALIYRNYWALVLGGIIGMVAGLIGGYVVHPYRPRWRLTHSRELFGFSQWMLVSGIGIFFARKLDGFVVGRVGTAGDLGVYNVALELGQMITTELGAPLNRALLPVLANLHEEPERMQRALMKTLAAVNTVTLPAGLGLAMVAPLAVPVLLGPRWSAAIPLLVLFSVIGALRFMTGPYYTMLMTLGRSRLLAFMSWIELAIFALAVAWFYREGVKGIAEARVVSTAFIGFAWLFVGMRFGLRVPDFLLAVARPLGASLLMCAAIWALPALGLPAAFELAYQILIGGVVYLAAIVASWVGVGKPDGLERMAVDRLASMTGRPARTIG